MREIEEDVRGLRLHHLLYDRTAHDVARRKFGAFVVILHETVAVLVDKTRSFAAHRFRDKTATTPRDVEHRRMELQKFHVAADRARAERHRDPVAGGALRIRRFSIDLPDPAGRQDCLLGPDQLGFAFFLPINDGAAAEVVEGEKVEGERVFPNANIRATPNLFDRRPNDFCARGVAVRVQDAEMVVTPFASEKNFAVFVAIELRAVVEKLAHFPRPASDDHFNRFLIA